jgi:hypothetical protein
VSLEFKLLLAAPLLVKQQVIISAIFNWIFGGLASGMTNAAAVAAAIATLLQVMCLQLDDPVQFRFHWPLLTQLTCEGQVVKVFQRGECTSPAVQFGCDAVLLILYCLRVVKQLYC